MKDEIKELLFLLHNDRLTESGKRKLEDYITNLQERNKKAIEYIERAKYVTETMEGEEFYKNYEYSKEDLLNILQGEDKDE